MIKHLTVVVLFFKAVSIFAQDNPAQDSYLFSPRVSITVPHPTGNGAFKKNFAGVYELSASFDVMIFKGLFVGGAYKNGTLKVIGITGVSNFNYNPLMKINNAGIRVGGQTYLGARNRVIYSAAVAAGRNWTRYESLKCKDSTKSPPMQKYATTYIEPEMSLYFLIENNFAIGVTVTYSIYNKSFDPAEICLNEWKAAGSASRGRTQYLSFGFGFNYSFYKKKN